MAVLCEAISVVVDVRALAARYPGGLAGYAAAVPNRTFCCDGSVARVGFMAAPDAARWIDIVAAEGLTVGSPDADVAVVDQIAGITSPCDWLSSTSDGSVRIAWRTGDDPAQVYVPAGWNRGLHEAITYVAAADLGAAATADDARTTAVRDPRTGRPLLQGRIADGTG